MPAPLTVIGAGPVGSLLALFLARRGHDVQVFERRPDMRKVAIDAGRIVALAPTAEAFERFDAREVVRLDRHALIPGLVNLHCHAAMALMRGLADDVALMAWLNDHIWPAEARHVSDEFVHDGSLLAAAEMLRGGVTCVNDMYFFPEATARAALRAGIRAVLGIIALEFPSAYAPDASGYLQKGLATRDAYRGEPLLSFALAPRKSADLAAVELSSLETLPRFDPVSHLVYAAGREHVSHVWVEGRARMAARRLTGIDEDDLRTRTLWWQERLS